MAIVLLLIVVLLSLFQLHVLEGVSMAPAFADGQWLLVRRDSSPPQRYEAIVMRSSGSEVKTVIKRAIAFGGESILIRDGDALIDGKPMLRSDRQIRSTLVPYLRLADLDLRGRGRRRSLVGRNDLEMVLPLKGRCELSAGGDFLKFEAGDDGAVARIPAMSFKDDHLSPKGRWRPGTEIVQDIVLTLKIYEVDYGGSLELAQILDGKAAWSLALERRHSGWHLSLRDENGALFYEVLRDHSLENLIRVHAIDQTLRLEAALDAKGREWSELFRQELSRPSSRRESWLRLSVVGAPRLILARLEIDRDIHYTSQQTDAAYGVRASFEVPRGQVFVLGDNSPESRDSRHWGALEIAENVVGRPVFSIWPRERWGRVTSNPENSR